MIKHIRFNRVGNSLMWRIMRCVGTLNAEKIGGHRRGSLLLVDARWDVNRCTSVLTWEKPRVLRDYNHASHRDLIRAIARSR